MTASSERFYRPLRPARRDPCGLRLFSKACHAAFNEACANPRDVLRQNFNALRGLASGYTIRAEQEDPRPANVSGVRQPFGQQPLKRPSLRGLQLNSSHAPADGPCLRKFTLDQMRRTTSPPVRLPQDAAQGCRRVALRRCAWRRTRPLRCPLRHALNGTAACRLLGDLLECP